MWIFKFLRKFWNQSATSVAKSENFVFFNYLLDFASNLADVIQTMLTTSWLFSQSYIYEVSLELNLSYLAILFTSWIMSVWQSIGMDNLALSDRCIDRSNDYLVGPKVQGSYLADTSELIYIT